MRAAVRHLSCLVSCLAAIFGAAPASAFSTASLTSIARLAASISPPDLARQLERHQRAYLRAVEVPQEVSAGLASGRPLRLLARDEARASVAAIENHQPFSAVAARLGVLAHLVARANDPLLLAPAEARDRALDYQRYLESAEPRFPIVFYGEGRALAVETDLEQLLGVSFGRGSRFQPMIEREYRRVGKVDGVALFDDRSTAFGVGSLSFSHAVSDVAAVLRYVWIAAGGSDPRQLPITAALGPSAEPAGR